MKFVFTLESACRSANCLCANIDSYRAEIARVYKRQGLSQQIIRFNCIFKQCRLTIRIKMKAVSVILLLVVVDLVMIRSTIRVCYLSHRSIYSTN